MEEIRKLLSHIRFSTNVIGILEEQGVSFAWTSSKHVIQLIELFFN